MNGDRPGKPPKPPLKASKGDIQLAWGCRLLQTQHRTASVKGADEQRAGVAHAKWIAEERAAQVERDAAAAAAKRRSPGRPRLTSGISSRGAHEYSCTCSMRTHAREYSCTCSSEGQ